MRTFIYPAMLWALATTVLACGKDSAAPSDGPSPRIAAVDVGLHPSLAIAPTDIGSVTIEAPAAGKVLLMFSGHAIFFGDATVVTMGLGRSAAATDLYATRFGRQDGTGTGRYDESFSGIAVVDVAGGTHTFYLTGARPAPFTTNSVNLADLYLVAIAFPD